MKTPEYLDAVKAKLGLSSDYQLSKALNVTRASISGLRLGKSHLSDETAMRAAAILGCDAARIVADMHAERATSPEVRALWQRMANQWPVCVMSTAVRGLLRIKVRPFAAA